MTDHGSALVVWGSTGRRLQFSRQDLRMPADLRDSPHFHFYEKQWDAVAGFWFNRVLKESSLQHLTVDRIVELIREDIAKRWEKRRREQSLHKKCTRLLQGNGPAGAPVHTILLTNVVALDSYAASTEDEKKELLRAVVERVEFVSKDTVSSWKVLVDDAAARAEASEEGAPLLKKSRSEGDNGEMSAEAPANGAPAAVFDDRVAVICALSSKAKAALAIAHLHGSKLDGRAVLCRFWGQS
ncbi:hypothetical protein ABB37_10101 [Leptomonas pyrrhocoris]|uniref:Uncharacterized protein n=1 Tax=Leptomonas pyrrhocoris TaxID=157538 RepID=A0A0M9FNZ0_LEPPY|nr:hypothetical protein ABB37_10101 [Leptomonas pyrrhocoris]KPA73120.1 hypothetical protein ABB37_10101 [Leptomonas pyrrhocoris]|eukprot:XP_015651559.1 hypothetical protein ABB37_10101 [Leptomonas pyrrhocoris]